MSAEDAIRDAERLLPGTAAPDGDRDARIDRLRQALRDDAVVTIVDATGDDAEAILALQRLAYESEARRYDNWSIPPLVETLASVRQFIESHVVLKAMLDERLVGSVRAAATNDVGEIGRLIVDPDVQRRGIGSRLLSAIERRFPTVPVFELFTGDRSAGNLRLYERHGYVVCRTEPVSPAVSLVYLRKAADVTDTPP